MSDMTTQSAPRPPGRPRSVRADEAIIEAVLGFLAEGTTVEALSMEAVAARAGVGKATVYRRWAHKDALVLDAVASLKSPLEEPPGEDLRADLVLLLNKSWEKRDSRAGQIMPCIIPELQRQGPLREQFLEFMDNRRDVMRRVLQRGIDSGELRSDTDVELVLILLAGPMMMKMIGNAPRLNEVQLAERVVDTVLHGLVS